MTGSLAATVPHLPVGLVTEPSAPFAAGRLALAAAGAALLLAGSRRPRTAAAILAALAALPPALAAARIVPPLAVAGLWALAAVVGHALLGAHPRLGSALAASWVGPAAYLVALLAAGSFRQSLPLLLALLAAGAGAGALLPRLGWALGTAAGGTAALAVAAGLGARPVPLAAVWLSGTVAQLAIPPLRGGPRPLPAGRETARELGRVAGGVLAVSVAAALVAVLAAPAPPPRPGRLARLEATGQRLPALLLSAPDAFWLTGHATPVAVAGGGGPSGRLLALLRPSADGAVRRLRAVKEPGEIAAIRRAAAATTAAMERAAAMVRPGVGEGEIAAAVEATCRAHGAQALAFPSIVAAGAHATLPHWERDDGVLEEGLVVVDIGCQVDGYAADMTRTFVVAPPPTPEAQELLDLVAEAKAAAEAELRPGATLGKVHRAARAVFERAGMERYFLHFVGHHVGIEVHDPGRTRLQAGMVVTVEPGLYVAAGSPVDPTYWNLGVRIEDTYLVTEDGWERLTGRADGSARVAPSAR